MTKPTAKASTAAARVMKVTRAAIARVIAGTRHETVAHPYKLPEPLPGVVPEGAGGAEMAMDYDPGISAAYGFSAAAVRHEGLGFMGFPYLAELTQRPEYRRGAEILAKEMTRKWIALTYDGDGDKAKALKLIESDLERYKIQDLFRRAAELDGWYGRSHIYIDTGEGDRPE